MFELSLHIINTYVVHPMCPGVVIITLSGVVYLPSSPSLCLYSGVESISEMGETMGQILLLPVVGC
jgi:hypothetical protein